MGWFSEKIKKLDMLIEKAIAEKPVASLKPMDAKPRKKRAKIEVIETTLFDIKQAPGEGKRTVQELLPVRVDKFDELIADRGIERGATLLISGGTGTGKTTFCMQSLYHGALRGEKGLFLSFEEDPKKIKKHMKKNFGWDFGKLEKQGIIAMVKFDPSEIARQVEESLLKKSGGLKIAYNKMELPFLPDRIVVDSLSALSIGFEDADYYRKYVRELFESLEATNSINFVISETEQNPKIYSRTGVEEFLADGVIVLYNLKKNDKRENAIEILKLRSSSHLKNMVPYKITPSGMQLTVPKNKE